MIRSQYLFSYLAGKYISIFCNPIFLPFCWSSRWRENCAILNVCHFVFGKGHINWDAWLIFLLYSQGRLKGHPNFQWLKKPESWSDKKSIFFQLSFVIASTFPSVICNNWVYPSNRFWSINNRNVLLGEVKRALRISLILILVICRFFLLILFCSLLGSVELIAKR